MAAITTTRPAILIRAMGLVPRLAFASVDGVTGLTATSGAATTLIDTANGLPAGYASSTHKDWFIERPTAANGADKVATVLSYSGSAHQWTTNSTWVVNPASSIPYRVTKDHPNLWERALNEALRSECFFVRHDEWVPTSNTQRKYDPTAAPISITDIARIGDLHDIQWHRTADPSNEEVWRSWSNGAQRWEFYESNGTRYIDFFEFRPSTVMTLRLVSTHPFATLTDETTTTQVDVEWAAYATLLQMARMLANPQLPNDEWTKIGRPALAFCRDRRRQTLGRFAFRTSDENNRRAPAFGIGGRAGRSTWGTRVGRR